MTQKEKAKGRPSALNTVEMLRSASSGLGESPDTEGEGCYGDSPRWSYVTLWETVLNLSMELAF